MALMMSIQMFLFVTRSLALPKNQDITGMGCWMEARQWRGFLTRPSGQFLNE